MAEWLYEEGIGESRAILVEGDTILEALVEWDDMPWRVGAIVDARMGELNRAQGRGFVRLPDGTAAILTALPATPVSQGTACRIEIVREPMRERSRQKWAKARLVEPGVELRAGPGLAERIGTARRIGAHEADLFEAVGWSELLEEAATGEIPFVGGGLHLSMTPAMTLIDVDGALPPAELAVAGAAAAGRAIRRLGIGGSIGIDLPTVEGRAARAAAADALDAVLPQPYERTAVNGFGFLQLVRRRDRRALPEMLAQDPEGAAVRALLRRAERTGGHGALVICAAPAVIARFEAEAAWQAELARRTGRQLLLRADPELSRWGGHVDAEHP